MIASFGSSRIVGKPFLMRCCLLFVTVTNVDNTWLVAQTPAPLPSIQAGDRPWDLPPTVLHDNPPRTLRQIGNPPAETVSGRPVQALSLREFEQAALANHPAIAKVESRIREAKWRCQQAGLHPDMIVGYNGGEMGSEGTAGLQGGFIGQEFITGKKRQLDQCIISKQIQYLEQYLAEVQQRILTDVRMEVVAAFCDQEREKIRRRLLLLNRRAEQSAKRLIDNNEIPRRTYLEIRSTVDLAELKLSSAQQEHLASWRRLICLSGLDDIPLAEVTNAGFPKTASPNWNGILATVLGASPELATAFSQIEKQRYEIARARAERYPNITGRVMLQHDDVTSDDITSVMASIPFPRKRRVQAQIGQAAARLRQAEQHAELVTRSIRHRLATEYEKLETACREAKTYEERILPRSVESRKLTKQALDNDEINDLQWVASERAFLRTMEEHLDALQRCWMSRYRIEGFMLGDSFDLQRQP